MNFPKILIIGETFHQKSGGGITLSNLFKDWPKERLSNATDFYRTDMTKDFVNISVYELKSNKRIMNLFPYNLVERQKSILNEEILLRNPTTTTTTTTTKIKTIIKKLCLDFLNYTSLSYVIFRYRITKEFIDWIEDFRPDYIYTQLGSMELIHLVNQVHQITNIPIAVHIMDDWPSWFGTKGFFKRYWKYKFNNEFVKLLNRSSIFLSISEKMSDEYGRRYNKHFTAFHNPLDLEKWSLDEKLNSASKRHISILHAGRIGRGIDKSLIDAAIAIDMLNKEGYNVTFNIQSSAYNEKFIDKVKKYNCVIINPKVEYKQIPKIFKNADILFLCNDFDKSSIDFLKYSMPTKASEYMISRKPIIMYCSKDIAIYEYAKKYDLAYLISENNIYQLKEGFKEVIKNEELSSKLALNAFYHAKCNFDSKIVRENFRLVFYNNLIGNLENTKDV